EVAAESAGGLEELLDRLAHRVEVGRTELAPQEALARVVEGDGRGAGRAVSGPDAHDRERRAVADEVGCSLQRPLSRCGAVVADDDLSRTGSHTESVGRGTSPRVRELSQPRCGKLRSR